MTRVRAWVALIALAVLSNAASAAESVIPGPVPARVERVIDGDTLEARALVWPGTEVLRSVRARGMDAPEIRRSTCPAERARGEAARAYLATLVAGQTVYLTEIADDKYGGRVDARITTLDGDDIAHLLIAKKLADPEGSRPREHLCAVSQ